MSVNTVQWQYLCTLRCCWPDIDVVLETTWALVTMSPFSDITKPDPLDRGILRPKRGCLQHKQKNGSQRVANISENVAYCVWVSLKLCNNYYYTVKFLPKNYIQKSVLTTPVLNPLIPFLHKPSTCNITHICRHAYTQYLRKSSMWTTAGAIFSTTSAMKLNL